MSVAESTPLQQGSGLLKKETPETGISVASLFVSVRDTAPLTFREALGPIVDEKILLQQHVDDFLRVAQTLKEGTFSGHLLTADEIAACRAYTSACSGCPTTLHKVMNDRCYEPSRSLVRIFLNFMWLLLNALSKLEPFPNHTVFRGVKLDSEERQRAFRAKYNKATSEGSIVTWHGFASCTREIQQMDSPEFCSTRGHRAIFIIQLTSGQARDISGMSEFAHEKEVLLPPGCRFINRGVAENAQFQLLVYLEEIQGVWIRDLRDFATVQGGAVPTSNSSRSIGSASLQEQAAVAAAEAKARKAEARALVAEAGKATAEAGRATAEVQLHEAEERALLAEARAEAAEGSMQALERRVAEANGRVEEAEKRAAAAEERADAAGEKAAEAAFANWLRYREEAERWIFREDQHDRANPLVGVLAAQHEMSLREALQRSGFPQAERLYNACQKDPRVQRNVARMCRDLLEEGTPVQSDALLCISCHTTEEVSPFYRALTEKLLEGNVEQLAPYFPFINGMIRAFAALPGAPRTVYRAEVRDSSLQVGQEFYWWTFVSTISVLNIALDYLMQQLWRGGEGRDITNLSTFPYEHEVLLFPGTKMKVRGIFTDRRNCEFLGITLPSHIDLTVVVLEEQYVPPQARWT